MAKTFLGSSKLGQVLSDLTIGWLDIGAREGITRDLLPIAPAVAAFGFEPDPDECARLNQPAYVQSTPWKSLKFVPVALAGNAGERTLNLYKMRGGSSLFEADTELAAQFARAENFKLERTVKLQTVTLDAAADQFGFKDASYIKLDIQGAELEVLQSASRLLRDSVVALRVEIEFLPIYKGQPLQGDIDQYLRSLDFVHMGIVEPRHWRRTTRKRFSFQSNSFPYSRGQIAHADFVYFRNPLNLPDGNPEEIEKCLKAAFLALNYECVDHAFAILGRPAIADYLTKTHGMDVKSELTTVSRHLAMRHLRRQISEAAGMFGEAALQTLGTLIGKRPQVLGKWRHR